MTPIMKRNRKNDSFSHPLSHPWVNLTLSRSWIIFSDKNLQTEEQDGRENIGESMMLKCCKAAKHYSTQEGLGGSWMVIQEDDAIEEGEVLDGGGDVEDGWDLEPEAERFMMKGRQGEE